MLCSVCYTKQQIKCLKCFKAFSGDEDPLYVGKYLATFHKSCFACKKCSSVIDDPGAFTVKGNDLYHKTCSA